MKNIKTTIIGLAASMSLAAWGVFQPAITGGKMDLKLLIPAAVIAVIGVLQKDLGSWKTTTVGMVLAAVLAGTGSYQTDPNQWALVIGSVLTSIGASLTKDFDHNIANNDSTGGK